jgi:hypothetical protein
MAQHTEVVAPDTFGVGSAVRDRTIHDAHFFQAHFSVVESRYSGYSAHRYYVLAGKLLLQGPYTIKHGPLSHYCMIRAMLAAHDFGVMLMASSRLMAPMLSNSARL